jgi:hypothetical protein
MARSTTTETSDTQAVFEAVKDIVIRRVDVVNSGTLDAIEEVWADDCVVHTEGVPEVSGAQSRGALLKVAARFTTRGRHDGEFLDIPATGVPIEIGGFGLFRIAEGGIAEEWLLDDLAAFITQAKITSASAQTGGAS